MSEHGADIEHLAELARLDLDPDERARFAEQLDRILAYVQQLQGVDVAGVPPTEHVLECTDVYRQDEPQESLPRRQVLEAAPESDEERFVVPGVLPT